MGEGKGVPVVAMLGRVRIPTINTERGIKHNRQFHPYEGHKLATVVYPIRVLARLGVKDIISEL